MGLERECKLISPYGGRLVELSIAPEGREEALERARGLRSLQLSPRSTCDLELLATGAFSPLDRFMGEADYRRVVEEMRLSDGTLFPIPITLSVVSLDGIRTGEEVTLRSAGNNILAIMRVEEIFERDIRREAEKVCACADNEHHPLAVEMNGWGRFCLSGPIQVMELPSHHDFMELRRTPADTRRLLASMGNPNVVAFQTRNPMHRAHEELTKRAASQASATLLIHPAVGMTKPGDIDHFTRVRIYRSLVEKYYGGYQCLLSLVPLAMRMAGPREALWHAIIRRNYGANHFIIGRDHAGPGKNPQGMPFYAPYAARDLLAKHSGEIGVRPLPFEEMVYLEDEDRYEESSAVPQGARVKKISGTEVRHEIREGSGALPAWFTRPETAEILKSARTWRQGFCLWFTGLPSAGKSTIAEIVKVLLMAEGRYVTVLDGDVVRTHLSKGLGFSREDRDLNILRIGFVASEIVRHGGIAICAAVSPYRNARNQVRNMMPPGHFIEIFVNTPVEECEQRDVKGFYARARAGQIKGFTGVDDPYEPPDAAEIELPTIARSPGENGSQILAYLMQKGFVEGAHRTGAPPLHAAAEAAQGGSLSREWNSH